MNRVIKFRGQRVDNGEWVYGSLVATDLRCYIVEKYNCYIKDPILIEVIPETVGQFTGLTDKNGVEIYEGDIIDWHFATEFNKQVRPKRIVAWHDKSLSYIAGGESLFKLKDIQVIGNIHSNPTHP